jgi:cytochrome P450
MWEALAGRLGDRARFEGAMSRMVDRLHRALSAEDGAVTAAAALGRAWRAGHCSALEALGMAVAILQGMTRTSAMLAAGALRDGLLRCEARFPAHESAQRWVERALRERPPVHTITRIALREARLGTHVVPAGTPVAVCLRALRGDRLWAFGHGPHACPGGRTGQAAAAAMVAAILDRLPGLRIDESACGPRPSHPIFSEPTRLPLRWTPA